MPFSVSQRVIEYVLTAQDKASKVVDGFEKRLQSSEKSLKRLGDAGKGLSIIGAAGAAAIGVLAAQAGRVQQLQVAFETMLGSAEKAKEMIEELSNFASRTPFTLPGVERSAQQLLAVGFAAEEVIPTLKMVGDVAAGLSLGEDGLQRLIVNLGQIRAQGKLTGRELRDFAVNGVPLLDELAKMFGKTKAQIMEMVSAGQISDKAVTQAFRNMSGEGGRFANLMDKQSRTFLGAMSNMQDSLTRLARVLGEPLIAPLTAAATHVAKLAEKVGDFTKAHPKITEFVAKVALLTTAFALVVGPLALIISKLGFLVKAMEGAFVATKLVMGAFIAAGPIAIALAIALGAVATALIKVRNAHAAASESITASYNAMIEDTQKYSDAAKELTGNEKKFAELRSQSTATAAQVQALIEERRAKQASGASKEVIAAMDQEISKANERASEAAHAAVDFSSSNEIAMDKVKSTLEEGAVASGGFAQDFTADMESAGESGETELEKVQKAMESLGEEVGDTSDDIVEKIRNLDAEHEKNMSSIQEKIDDVIGSLKKLRGEYKDTMADINMQVAEGVIEQEDELVKLRDELADMEKRAKKKEGGPIDADDQEEIDRMKARIRKEEEALKAFQERGVAAAEDLAEARRRANLTSFERHMEDLAKEREEETAQFEEKQEQLQAEFDALEASRIKAIETYEAHRNEMELIQIKVGNLRDTYISALNNMDTQTAQSVESMKKYLNELQKIIASIDSLMQGGANRTGTQRGLERATQRATGGMVDEAMTIVGENGPELAVFPKGTRIHEAGQTRRELSGGNANTFSITAPLIGMVVVQNEADEQRLARTVSQELARQIQLQNLRSA